MYSMISVSEALQRIEAEISPLQKIDIELRHALQYLLAEDLFATIDSPPFAQSAMDGYAFRFEDLQTQNIFPVQDQVQAGDTRSIFLQQKHCIRIFTGAPIPQGADTVIMQEHTESASEGITFLSLPTEAGANVRLQGSQIKKGSLIGQLGHQLNPASMGYFAGFGFEKIRVFDRPRVAIIITGQELVKLGNELLHGQVYESNSVMLEAALQEGGFEKLRIYYAEDTLEATMQALETAMASADVVLLTGGISVGDFDFVSMAMDECGIEKILYKVKQKPGKPFCFGKRKGNLIFALPGNPASVFTCFCEYVVPALRKLKGLPFLPNNRVRAQLTTSYSKKAGLTHFVKAKQIGSEVSILEGQESYKLSAFVTANALVSLPEESTQWQTGDWVEVHTLDALWT